MYVLSLMFSLPCRNMNVCSKETFRVDTIINVANLWLSPSGTELWDLVVLFNIVMI